MSETAANAPVVISQMLAPALFIMASANLAQTALQRLGRIIDRSRELKLDGKRQMKDLGVPEASLTKWIRMHAHRADLVEGAVQSLFAGIVVLVLACISIAVDHYVGIFLVPISLTVIGACFLLYGAWNLLLESRLSAKLLKDESEVLEGDII